jgi:hypothetical protein
MASRVLVVSTTRAMERSAMLARSVMTNWRFELALGSATSLTHVSGQRKSTARMAAPVLKAIASVEPGLTDPRARSQRGVTLGQLYHGHRSSAHRVRRADTDQNIWTTAPLVLPDQCRILPLYRRPLALMRAQIVLPVSSLLPQTSRALTAKAAGSPSEPLRSAKHAGLERTLSVWAAISASSAPQGDSPQRLAHKFACTAKRGPSPRRLAMRRARAAFHVAWALTHTASGRVLALTATLASLEPFEEERRAPVVPPAHTHQQ